VGHLVLVTAETSGIRVAEEAAITAETLGNRVNRIYGANVAGIHRILTVRDNLYQANVAVVLVGMAGTLASVLGVPTNVGYGASFGGVAALLCILNSCASGVSVVNIDDGFDAAYQASLINKLAAGQTEQSIADGDGESPTAKGSGSDETDISPLKAAWTRPHAPRSSNPRRTRPVNRRPVGESNL
jgi:hypothetical protein